VMAPLNFSVVSDTGAALFPAVCTKVPFSIDELLRRRSFDLFELSCLTRLDRKRRIR
jgi:hypothetical protein